MKRSRQHPQRPANPVLFLRSPSARGYLAIAAVVVCAVGCATTPEPPADPDVAWAERQLLLAAIDRWYLVGRIGVVTEDDGGSATLRWRQRGAAYEIDLRGPFGRGLARLHGDTEAAVLQTPDGDSWVARDAETLFERQLGWRVPVTPLRKWVLGLADAEDAYELDAWGRISTLHRGVWQVRFLAYRAVDGLELPKSLYLRRDGLGIKLAIDEWTLNPPPDTARDGSPA